MKQSERQYREKPGDKRSFVSECAKKEDENLVLGDCLY
jgi:hypothetical protein